ncbi:hypothetical protein M8J77_007725 [Diaphorina citri]|nr:hypothetical protein M8J77_007725 [Diaphorina citri]
MKHLNINHAACWARDDGDGVKFLRKVIGSPLDPEDKSKAVSTHSRHEEVNLCYRGSVRFQSTSMDLDRLGQKCVDTALPMKLSIRFYLSPTHGTYWKLLHIPIVNKI